MWRNDVVSGGIPLNDLPRHPKETSPRPAEELQPMSHRAARGQRGFGGWDAAGGAAGGMGGA